MSHTHTAPVPCRTRSGLLRRPTALAAGATLAVAGLLTFTGPAHAESVAQITGSAA
ncbi:hypothetical protein [Streptomyces sp. TLI_146]|uniref:hypothetical protein n=1 Tax=Streptomyces sp. TLI_146 TaxID=1938858 RepID=UPI000CB991FC|nr:hypothetical protein [Streptomyces sp. TLI_146]PKV82898.1 hypothetical protein BX283_0365 [Streptomyces sp. TLI_146]